jgi:tetratricopeptide (TPR) repeat protein
MNRKGSKLVLPLFCSAVILMFGCAGNKGKEQKNVFIEKEKTTGQEAQETADQVSAADRKAVAAKDSESDREQNGSFKGQSYLRIRFKQKDTEVDLLLDPNDSNLAIDLIRGADGMFEVTRGDSTIFKKDPVSEKAPGDLVSDLGDLRNNKEMKNLTDEVVRQISLAQKMFYEERYEEALEVLKTSLEKKQTATAYALGGSIYYVNGDIDQAVNAWENALRINPEMSEVRDLIARYKE